jgi:hypothetical protein
VRGFAAKILDRVFGKDDPAVLPINHLDTDAGGNGRESGID